MNPIQNQQPQNQSLGDQSFVSSPLQNNVSQVSTPPSNGAYTQQPPRANTSSNDPVTEPLEQPVSSPADHQIEETNLSTLSNLQPVTQGPLPEIAESTNSSSQIDNNSFSAFVESGSSSKANPTPAEITRSPASIEPVAAAVPTTSPTIPATSPYSATSEIDTWASGGNLSSSPKPQQIVSSPTNTTASSSNSTLQNRVTSGNTSALKTNDVINENSYNKNNVNNSSRKKRNNRKPSSIDRSRSNSFNIKDSSPNDNSEIKDEVIAEIEQLVAKVEETEFMPIELKERALRSVERLRRMARRGSYTGEFETVEKYVYWITSIPWGQYSQDNLEVSNAKRLMDQTHYGMNTVKNLVLDYLAVMQLQLANGNGEKQDQNLAAGDMAVLRGSSANAPVMIFVGLQGVGKTSIAKSIANAMDREFIRVAVGAVGSVQALRGQSKAFLDAEPGGIIKGLTRAKTMNPVILLDEIDKASGNSGLLNDIMAALLEILDPEQNSTFIDHYIDYPVDLSKVFFICTANNLGTLSAALLDRMEVIRFTSYTDEEKIVIAKNYSMPKVIKNSGLRNDQLIVEEAVWPILVRPVGFDAGLRQLERNLATMTRSVARRIVEGRETSITITPENVREFVLPDQGPLS